MDKKELVEKVKKSLWRFGYNVQDFSQTDLINFDLLVEAKFKVQIGNAVPDRWPDDCNVFALVDSERVKFIKKPKRYKEPRQREYKLYFSPYSVFGKQNNVKITKVPKGQNDQERAKKKGRRIKK